MQNLSHVETDNNNMTYEPYTDDKKIVIYTCITGKYDNVLEPYYIDEKCDYILFTDQDINSAVYKVLDIPENIKELENNILINRYIKMHPHELFGQDYDYAIYIDGNIQQISNLSSFVNKINEDIGISMHKHSMRNCIYDEGKVLKIYKKGNSEFIKKQLIEYEKEGFPTKYGMVEASVIVTDLNNNMSKEILNDWWNEFLSKESMRDQLSLPYILWKKDIKIDELTMLGNNVYKNPKFRIVKHI